MGRRSLRFPTAPLCRFSICGHLMCIYAYPCVRMRVYLSVYTYACILIRVYVYVYTYACILIRVYVYVYTYPCILIHVYVSVYTYMCIRIRVYVSVYTYPCICFRARRCNRLDTRRAAQGVTTVVPARYGNQPERPERSLPVTFLGGLRIATTFVVSSFLGVWVRKRFEHLYFEKCS